MIQRQWRVLWQRSVTGTMLTMVACHSYPALQRMRVKHNKHWRLHLPSCDHETWDIKWWPWCQVSMMMIRWYSLTLSIKTLSYKQPGPGLTCLSTLSPNIKTSILRSSPSQHNNRKLIYKITYLCFPLLAALDCKNCIGERGCHTLQPVVIFYVILYYVIVFIWL